MAAVSVRVLCTHVREDIIVKENHIDPSKWNPLVYDCHYQGLGPEPGKTFKAQI